jgi:hypothetical protein
MTSRSTLPPRSSIAVAFALALGGANLAQAVPSGSDTFNDITIYRQLGYAFGFSNATPSGLFGAVGGGGAGGTGGFGGMISQPSPILLSGAPIVGGGAQGGGDQSPSVEPVVQVPETGIGKLGFGLALALLALTARRQSDSRRIAAGMPSE